MYVIIYNVLHNVLSFQFQRFIALHYRTSYFIR